MDFFDHPLENNQTLSKKELFILFYYVLCTNYVFNSTKLRYGNPFTATLKYHTSKMKQKAKATSLSFAYAGNMLQLVHMCCISKASCINNVPA